MERHLFVRILSLPSEDPADIDTEWLLCSSEGEVISGPAKGSLLSIEETLAEENALGQAKTVFILPGDQALLVKVPVSEAQMKHIKQALPYMLEDHLVNDVDDMLIVTNSQVNEGTLPVAAIAHESMSKLFAAISDLALNPYLCISEAQLVNTTSSEVIQVVVEGDKALMAIPEDNYFSVDTSILPMTLQTVLENPAEYRMIDAEDDPTLAMSAGYTRLKVTVAKPVTLEIKRLLKQLEHQLQQYQIELEFSALKGAIFHYLCRSFLQNQNRQKYINLFQNQYSVSADSGAGFAKWKSVIYLAATWVFVTLGLHLGQAIYFGQQSDALHQQAEEVFRSIYPNARNVFDLKDSMTSRMKQNASSGGEGVFIKLLVDVSSVTQQLGSQQIKPKSLDFNSSGNSLMLEVNAKSYEVLDAYVNQLKQRGMSAKLETANQEKETVLARINIQA